MGFPGQFWTQPQRTWLRRALFQVHLWTGIGVGLYVLVISVSGSAVVFRQDIYRAIETPVIIVEPSGERMTLEALTRHVQQAWTGYEVTQSYQDERNPNRAIELTFEKGWSRKQRLFNPYTGEDLGAAIRWEIRWVSWFEDLHFNLFGGTTGRRVNAVGAMLFTLLGLTGAVIWWQGIQKWRRGLGIKLRSGWKRFNWDLHSAVGFWTLLLILMWGLTGVFVSVPDPFRAAVDYFEPLQQIPRAPREGVAQRVQGVTTESPAGGERQGRGEAQRGEGVRGGQRGGGQRGNRGGRPRYQQRVGDRILRWAYDLHFGNFGGYPLKAVWVVLGLAPALLFVSGAVMWWTRVIRRNS
jgi:uncharacterized iron-regulated membrane protein